VLGSWQAGRSSLRAADGAPLPADAA